MWSLTYIALLLIITLLDTEHLVVVLLLCLLLLLLGVLELLAHTESGWVNARSSAKVVHCLVPELEVLVDFATLHERLGILWHHFQADVELLKSLFITIEFYLADRLVQADR